MGKYSHLALDGENLTGGDFRRILYSVPHTIKELASFLGYDRTKIPGFIGSFDTQISQQNINKLSPFLDSLGEDFVVLPIPVQGLHEQVTISFSNEEIIRLKQFFHFSTGQLASTIGKKRTSLTDDILHSRHVSDPTHVHNIGILKAIAGAIVDNNNMIEHNIPWSIRSLIIDSGKEALPSILEELIEKEYLNPKDWRSQLGDIPLETYKVKKGELARLKVSQNLETDALSNYLFSKYNINLGSRTYSELLSDCGGFLEDEEGLYLAENISAALKREKFLGNIFPIPIRSTGVWKQSFHADEVAEISEFFELDISLLSEIIGFNKGTVRSWKNKGLKLKGVSPVVRLFGALNLIKDSYKFFSRQKGRSADAKAYLEVEKEDLLDLIGSLQSPEELYELIKEWDDARPTFPLVPYQISEITDQQHTVAIQHTAR